MFKPWEEEWTEDGGRVELCKDEQPYGSVVVGCVGTFHHREEDGACLEGQRAKLAAAAPEMARVLLELRKGGTVLQRGDEQLDQVEIVLRKAGVLPS